MCTLSGKQGCEYRIFLWCALSTPMLCFSVSDQLHISLSPSSSISLSFSFCLDLAPNLSISLTVSLSLLHTISPSMSLSLFQHPIAFLDPHACAFVTCCPYRCMWLQISLSLVSFPPGLSSSLHLLCHCPATSLSPAVRLYLSWRTGQFLWGLLSDMVKWS